MNAILDTTYLRQFFRIETAVPEDIIQREIDFVRDAFANFFDTAYTDAEDDAVNPQPDNPILIDQFKTAMAYLAITRLLSERLVLTGFGVVSKQDDYSANADDEKIHLIASHYVNDASTTLHSIDVIKNKDITGCIAACQSYVNDFFPKKEAVGLYKYFPYTYNIF